MSKEAIQKALGKIKSARDCHFAAIDPLLFEAEEILEEALAEQPAQQEPVAIALNTGTKQGVKWLKNVEHGTKLYTSPPAQRTWVGLTNEEILTVARDHYNPHQRPEISFARAIEARLKELNT